MGSDIKKHKLLGILTKQRIKCSLEEHDENFHKIPLGVSYEKIIEVIKCKRGELEILTSELYTNEEIVYHNAYDIEGICATEKGVSSFSNKKYLLRNNDRIKSDIKDWIQILIPIFSLIIALFSLIILNSNSRKNSDEIRKIKSEVFKLQKK